MSNEKKFPLKNGRTDQCNLHTHVIANKNKSPR